MVHRREINGEVVAFGHQGSVWQDAQTIFDHKTGSVWAQPYGSAFMGELAGYELELLPFTMTTWSQWKSLYPDTLAYADPVGVQEESLEESAIVVEAFGGTVAYPLITLGTSSVVNDTIGSDEEPIAVVLDDQDHLTWRVYLREGPDGEAMEFIQGPESGQITDISSGTTFHSVYGYGINGPLSSHHLQAIPASTIFTDQFLDYHPMGRLWAP